jgi:DNA topoisomerase I
MKLVIVESPTKANTIKKFLGKGYSVTSSYGHVRDLPKSKLGVDVEHDFEPQYVIPTKVRKRVTALKKAAAKADDIILATDEDREGEAIAWHLLQALDIEGAQRIVFHEITKRAIAHALEHPRDIDMHMVDAQQARRVLDRLVGYTLSPFLWKKIFRGLSAGRVQSVALRLIVDREAERTAFKPEEYWSIGALLKKEQEFQAHLQSIEGTAVKKLSIATKKEADAIVSYLETSKYVVGEVTKKQMRRNPSPPFTTSTLQQQAHGRLGMSARRTMRVAQALYEGGHITYMRTDSVNLSSESLGAAQKWISQNFGKRYVLDRPRQFKGKSKLAQEAHEAIRPTDPSHAPQGCGGSASFSDKGQHRLYELIWRRFMASQLPHAEFDATAVDIEATGSGAVYGLRANGNVMRFDGFLKVWETKITETQLPDLSAGAVLDLQEVQSEQHFTEPPPRYNEASLIKVLEEYGIGRPSTYAPIISVIEGRNYVEKDEGKRFVPTETGTLVNGLLVEHFPQIVDPEFTARMEDELDAIASGKEGWHAMIREFYEPFAKRVARKEEEVKKIEPPEEKTDEVCDECGKPMVVKRGRFGKFLACTGFPECKMTKRLITLENSYGPCPDCKEGLIIGRRTKTKRLFYGCSRYPKCEYATWKKPGSDEDS